MRPDYCPMPDDATPEGQKPCPACGATIEGNDPVRGVCQARYGYREPSFVRLVLIDKHNGQVV